MDTSKIIKGAVSNGRYTVTAPIVKEDYGLQLQIEGVELPETYQVDFSNSESSGTSVTMIGNADGVLIPRQFIDSGKDIFAFLYHVGADFGRTVYKFRIPNKVRPDRTNEEPTPEEQSVIDQAISALNTAVAQTAQDVIDADASAQSASADAERAEEARTGAETAQGKAEDAQESAERAKESAEQSANEARQKAESITGLTATATTLPEGSQATASYSNGVLSLGIPKGDKGESPVTLLLSKDVVYVPMDREYRTKIAITDNIYYEYRRGDEQIDGIMDYTGTLNGTNITCTNVQACTPTQKGYMRFTIPQGVPLRTNTDTQLVVNIRFVFDYTDLDGNRRTIARSIMFVGVMDGEQGEPGAKGNPGDDGDSPTVTITPITGGHRITITDNDGTKTFDVMDGDDYILTEEDKEEIADMVEVPSDWLKAFPTDIASGSIASFSDGADGLPLKSLVVDINPIQDLSNGDPSPENICPISGWTSVDVEHTGKNLFDISALIVGGISNQGRDIDNNTHRRSPYIFLKVGTYTVTRGSSQEWWKAFKYPDGKDSAGTFIFNTNANNLVTFTLDENVYVRFAFDYTPNNVQLELGSTATPYEPYTGRSITIDLGQTVYGGKLDVLSGELTVYPYYASYNGETLTGEWISDRDKYVSGATPTIGAQVVNIGAQGVTVQLEPHELNSLYGANNIWADSGDTEVEYRADTKAYIAKKIAEALASLT